MLSNEAEQFEAVMQDLCLAFNRPYTTDLSRVFWESLKHLRLDEVRRAAAAHRKNGKKFPTPKELIGDEKRATAPKPRAPDDPMSKWEMGANRIMFQLAYLDARRGFKPLGPDLLASALRTKNEYVRMAESAEAGGEPWEESEFIGLVYDGLEKLLHPGLADRDVSPLRGAEQPEGEAGVLPATSPGVRS